MKGAHRLAAGFLVLEHGIPSHDIFGRVFAALDYARIRRVSRRWFGQRFLPLDSDTVVAIDGRPTDVAR